LKVALVYPQGYGEAGLFGGGERYALELSKAIAKRTPTTLVTCGSARSSSRVGELRLEQFTARGWPRSDHFNPVSTAFLSALEDVDVVHCVAYGTILTDLAIAFARLRGRGVFITDVGGRALRAPGNHLPLWRLADGLLLLSEFAGSVFPGTRPCRRVIRGGVDLDQYSPSSEPGGRGVLFVGRLLPHKGPDLLLRALPEGVPAVVLGQPHDPAYLEHLHRLAANKDVHFVHDADDTRVAEEMRRAAVMVAPSVHSDELGRYYALPELLGLAVLEAMASGLPVVATQVGSLPELVKDGETGTLVPPNDAAALHDAIVWIVDHPGEGRAMGAAGRTRVETAFTWERVADECLEAYRA